MADTPTQGFWINSEKARHDQVVLDQALFGDWTLITAWGGIGSNRGGMHSNGVASDEAGAGLSEGTPA